MSSLSFGSDGTAYAAIHYEQDGPHDERFEATWSAKGTSYSVILACFERDGDSSVDCSDDDFTMRCDVPNDDPLLGFSCTGDGGWSTYPFSWFDPSPPPPPE